MPRQAPFNDFEIHLKTLRRTAIPNLPRRAACAEITSPIGSALVYSSRQPSPHAPVADLNADLELAGIRVVASVQACSILVQEALHHAPDVLVCDAPQLDADLLETLRLLASTAACPVLLFTAQDDVESATLAVEAGVHAYVVNGYGQQRLRSLVQLATVRFNRERALRADMLDVSTRFAERKVVERAKGILMRARQVSDDDAFQILRTASMHSNQRLGQVSEHIIASARFAEDLNLAGQLRMLSQRLVKLALLRVAGVQPELVKAGLSQAMRRVDSNLAALGKSLSSATFADLLGQVVRAWATLKHALRKELNTADVAALDALAEQLLQAAEHLSTGLESAGAAPPLRVLNVAGRQRMLCQRVAKFAVLDAMGSLPGAPLPGQGLADAQAAFEAAQAYLTSIPLTNKDIRATLDTAAACWAHMQAAVVTAGRIKSGQRARQLDSLDSIAVASEELLGVFEQLSAHYERSMQMLVG